MLLETHSSTVIEMEAKFKALYDGLKEKFEMQLVSFTKLKEEYELEIERLHAELEKIKLQQNDSRETELHTWYKAKLVMIKEANQRKLNELMADFEKDAKRWADEKSDLVKEFEKFKSESAFKEEEWKKKYEVIISQEVERRQETWQRGCDQLRIESETLKAIIEKKDREYEAKNKEWCTLKETISRLRIKITQLTKEVTKWTKKYEKVEFDFKEYKIMCERNHEERKE